MENPVAVQVEHFKRNAERLNVYTEITKVSLPGNCGC